MYATKFLLALLAAAAGIQALPHLDERQARTANMQLYPPGGANDCAREFIATYQVQDVTPCQNVDRGTIVTAKFTVNTFPNSCRIRVYSQPNCAETGPNANFYDFSGTPTPNDCHTQAVRSVKVIC